jgi:hypothetical protein
VEVASVKIYVGMPCGETIQSRTAICLVALVASSRIHRLNLHMDTYCDRGHNSIVSHALETGADAIMFIDSDQEFPADALNRLEAHNLPVVGATYRKRQPPHDLMGLWPGGEPYIGTPVGFQEVQWIPSGLMLVRREVFEKTPYPWFGNLYGKKPEEFVGSDIAFCRKARALGGYKVHCDFDLSRQVTHLAQVPLTYGG